MTTKIIHFITNNAELLPFMGAFGVLFICGILAAIGDIYENKSKNKEDNEKTQN